MQVEKTKHCLNHKAGWGGPLINVWCEVRYSMWGNQYTIWLRCITSPSVLPSSKNVCWGVRASVKVSTFSLQVCFCFFLNLDSRVLCVVSKVAGNLSWLLQLPYCYNSIQSEGNHTMNWICCENMSQNPPEFAWHVKLVCVWCAYCNHFSCFPFQRDSSWYISFDDFMSWDQALEDQWISPGLPPSKAIKSNEIQF